MNKLSNRVKDLTNKKFTRLTVIEPIGVNEENKQMYWLCSCECGNELEVRASSLLGGYTKSCGCLQKDRMSEVSSKHNMSDTKFYRVWSSMVGRCSTESCSGYKNYGGRGISVCDRWQDFPNFKQDMYEKYNKHRKNNETTTLDRIDNDGDYCPRNCRWITHKENNRDTQRSVLIEHKGEEKCIAEWADELDMTYDCLATRIRKGWPVEKAFNLPQNKHRETDLIEFEGEKKTLDQWAEDVGVDHKTLWARINNYGWSVEKALTTPVKG